jgi:CRP-like cAMP-binding protein
MRRIPMSETTTSISVAENTILAALPPEEMERIARSLQPVSLELGQVLYEPDQVIRRVYFPTEAVASLITMLEDGSTVEAGMVGYTGMVGTPIVLGAETSPNRALIQHSGGALMLPVEVLRDELKRGSRLQQSLLLFIHMLFTMVSQTAACNRLHTVEERLARWLLMMHDLVKEDDFILTQEFLSSMLGARRAGVTVAAGSLQRAGLITYKRGHIRILDREALEDSSCECFKIWRGAEIGTRSLL